MEGFFVCKGQDMSVEDDDYFSSIGNMYSGSQDPDEQNRAAEREAEKNDANRKKNRPDYCGNNRPRKPNSRNPFSKPPPNPVY